MKDHQNQTIPERVGDDGWGEIVELFNKIVMQSDKGVRSRPE